ncbi:MAG: hypothetical protein PHV36_08905 [Elusimicrobiales bacterium]|nr:hypothetical protein [Elusimicrobiales bacterium]
MKKSICLVFSALMIISAAAGATGVDFDGGKAAGPDIGIDAAKMTLGFSGDIPQPLHGKDNGWHQQASDWDQNHQDGHYVFGSYTESCRTFFFNAQSPLSVTEDIMMDEVGSYCRPMHGHTEAEYCGTETRYHTRKVTVNIGARKLEVGETERLEVCMKSPDAITANTGGMLYEYAVASNNNDSLFSRATVFTLTPGARRPSDQELTVTSAEVTPAGDVRMVIKDNRADYFKGGKITITADGQNIPKITPDMTPQELLNSFVKFKVSDTFNVAGSYELKLMDAPKAGEYAVTVRFSRSGPLSTGAEASTIATFDLR